MLLLELNHFQIEGCLLFCFGVFLQKPLNIVNSFFHSIKGFSQGHFFPSPSSDIKKRRPSWFPEGGLIISMSYGDIWRGGPPS